MLRVRGQQILYEVDDELRLELIAPARRDLIGDAVVDVVKDVRPEYALLVPWRRVDLSEVGCVLERAVVEAAAGEAPSDAPDFGD